MTPHNYEIVDCGAFCEVIFFCISPKNLLGDFFDSLSRFLEQGVEVVFSNTGDMARIGTEDCLSDLLVLEFSDGRWVGL
jgi:hypothetical protein